MSNHGIKWKQKEGVRRHRDGSRGRRAGDPEPPIPMKIPRDASYAGTAPLMGARFRLTLEQQADEHRRDHGPIAARQGGGIKALVHSC